MRKLLHEMAALSLAGVPPFSGFISKLSLLEAGIDARELAIVAVSLVVSFLTVFSMVRIWMGAFWSPPEGGASTLEVRVPRGGGPVLMILPTAALVVGSLVVALAAGPIFAFCERAAAELLDRSHYVNQVLGS